MGLHTSNYAGIYNIHFQPAEIVDSRFKFDMNLLAGIGTVDNNYIGIQRSNLFDQTAYDDPEFADKYLIERLNGKAKHAFVNGSIQGPSFMFSFLKKNALAFSTRANVVTNVEGVSEDLAQLLFSELSEPSLLNVNIENKNFSAQTTGWIDYGVTYGREVLNKGNHYLKGAVTGKLYQGLGNFHLFSDNLNVLFTQNDSLQVTDSDVSYGHSDNIGFTEDEEINYEIVSKPSFGFDLGVVYEFRPNQEQYTYEMDGRNDWVRRDQNKYKFKLGLSLTDMGSLRFTKGGNSSSFYANTGPIDLDEFEPDDIEQLDSILNTKYVVTGDFGSNYKVRMPMTINITADYNIWRGFYANATASIAPAFRNDPHKMRYVSRFSLTPRFEHKWAGVSIPLSYDAFGNFKLGLGTHLGPLILGTNDLFSFIGNKVIYGGNVYAGLRIPIPYGKKKDRDKDLVSNRMDDCKKEPGTWENKGCPDMDKDKDGVLDADDQCPETPGLADLNGCPDKDGDKIIDSKDVCPDTPGLEKFDGCPDSDGDNIIDQEDQCPTVAGEAKFMGCPDSDKDGLMDKEDDCPQTAGPKDNKGCPYGDADNDGLLDKEDDCPQTPGPKENKGCPFGDADNDGVLDKEDACPQTPGPKENKGCPWPDMDGDTVLDKDDKCPKTPGEVALNGCPKVEQEEKEIITSAFDNLEFETGKAIIRKISYSSLDRLAALMVKKSNYRLSIAGHTDSVGSAENNLALSQRRAGAVRDYLIKKGVRADRFDVVGYGEAQPIDTNDTPEGRQRNRRVELKLKFD